MPSPTKPKMTARPQATQPAVATTDECRRLASMRADGGGCGRRVVCGIASSRASLSRWRRSPEPEVSAQLTGALALRRAPAQAGGPGGRKFKNIPAAAASFCLHPPPVPGCGYAKKGPDRSATGRQPRCLSTLSASLNVEILRCAYWPGSRTALRPPCC